MKNPQFPVFKPLFGTFRVHFPASPIAAKSTFSNKVLEKPLEDYNQQNQTWRFRKSVRKNSAVKMSLC